ncbi:hypothetical protein VTK73DRAFT_1236 [Phialemonium thermophilum]|uniref:PWWP domain-containing protein n=1 Tax=Phialemonium thermophilum TaxID=223376 RepID=A0ABR3Y490_9PEZI
MSTGNAEAPTSVAATSTATDPVETIDSSTLADGTKEDAAPGSEAKDTTAEAATATKDDEQTAKSGSAADAEATETTANAPDTEMKDETSAQPASEAADVEGGDANRTELIGHDAEANEADASNPNTPSDKTKARRKSTGPADTKKKLNKKGSRAKVLHLDAKPGDHYFVKLKGFPQWPAIICDEDMLPKALLEHRPVTAARPDGTYREDYADGGKRVADRTYPVMYLKTNEFGWVPNTDLYELDPATVLDFKTDKMRKDLQAAHQLAAENHPLEYYKGLLQQYQENLIQEQKAKEAKAQATPAKKSKKAKGDEDVEMDDASGEEGEGTKKKSSKKRKAEESAETPQRSDSVKKPKIKLTVNSTPKSTNGTSSTPKSSKAQSQSKLAKSKPKKHEVADEDRKAGEVSAAKEPELSAEEKHARKKREVLFLRHKLQKGLLTRDQEPKEEEMKTMSDYITKLEALPDLEVSIIRFTKINKVLKAILKLETIPKEEEFHFKERSQVLLDRWNKLLAADAQSEATAAISGVNGTGTGDKADASKSADDAKESSAKDESISKSDTSNLKPEETADTKEPPTDKVPESVETAT